MTGSPKDEDGRGATGEGTSGPADQKTALDFQSALSEPAPEQRLLGETGSLREADPVPGPTVPEADQAAEPSRQPTAVLGGGGGRGDGEADAEAALDRPGAPALAGAAIAGALLVIAPFAVTAGMPAVSLDTVAEQTPVTSALGDQTGDGSAQTAGSAAAGADGRSSPVTERAADPGFVPEVQDGGTSPTLPDPGDASGGTGAVETSAPAEQGAGAERPSAQESSAESGSADATGGTETASADGPRGEAGTREGGVPAGGAEGSSGETAAGGTEDSVPAGGTEGSSGETAAGGTDTASENTSAAESEGSPETGTAGGENAPASAESDAAGSDTMSGTQADGSEGAESAGGSGGEAPAEPPLSGADSPESSSILANATEKIVPVEERYRALTGPGCAGPDDSSYSSEGRWESAEGTASWATRPGGYDQEGCEGSYDAIPVSGDPERGDHQHAGWTFAPGEEGAKCEIYVHVPDDESPLWVAPGEARYRIHPGSDAGNPPVAVFGFDQSQVRGGWVQVTGFVTPDEEFTVRLTNAGEDPFPDEEHTNAHVAASAMRVDCS